MADNSIYFDHHATTPVDPRVFEQMLPYFCSEFGNAGSNHVYGKSALKACEQARKAVASLVGASGTSRIIITSGATESNNLAIKGVALGWAEKGRHIITSNAEHWSVLATCRYLETIGFEVTYLPVDPHGMISAAQVERAIRHDSGGSVNQTILVTIMGANNEIGTINPVAEIAQVCRNAGVLYHCDGAQTVGKTPFHQDHWGIDFVSMSGHKMYAPKGIGILSVGPEVPCERLVPLMHGGGQENGLRSGTLPVSLMVGMGAACQIASTEMNHQLEHLSALRQELIDQLRQRGIPFTINGHPSRRLAGNLHVTFSDIEGECLQFAFKNIAVSSTSACSAGGSKPSHVLQAIGLSPEQASCSVRFGFGRGNTIDEVIGAADSIANTYKRFGGRLVDPSIEPHNGALRVGS